MMTVRSPQGLAIRYNNANYATRHTEYTDLYRKVVDGKGSDWIAQVPNSWLIELVEPCAVTSGGAPIRAAIERLKAHLGGERLMYNEERDTNELKRILDGWLTRKRRFRGE